MAEGRYQEQIQRRVGILLCVVSVTSALYNLGYLLAAHGDLSAALANIGSLLVMAAGGLLTGLITGRVFRIVQVIVLAAAGIFGIWINGGAHIGGISFIVLSVLLAIQYAMLNRFLLAKVASVAVLTFGIIVLRAAVRGEARGIYAGVSVVIFMAFDLALIWVMFSEEIKEYVERNRELVHERERNAVFVKFGKNVAGIVHNMRNLLNVLTGFNMLLQREVGSQKGKELLAGQKMGYDRLLESMNGLLQNVRIRHDTEVKPIDVNEIVSAIRELYRNDTEFSELAHLDVQLTDKKIMVSAQPSELSQVLVNLLENSRDAIASGSSADEKSISIRTFSGDAEGVAVVDNGCGIPGLERCTDDDCRDFFQVGRSTKTHGIGLGMPFVLEVAHAHEWRVEIESEVDRGTTVKILFRR